MSNQLQHKKITLRKILPLVYSDYLGFSSEPPNPEPIVASYTEDFEFPLPLYANKYKKKSMAIPGLDPVNPPGGGCSEEEKKLEWSKIIERVKQDLSPWLSKYNEKEKVWELSKDWWDMEPEHVCKNPAFSHAVKEALTISIAIPEWEKHFYENPDQWMNIVAFEWSQRLWNRVFPSEDWVCYVGPGQCVFKPKGLNKGLVCRVAEFMSVQSRSINGPLAPGEFGLAFPKGILSAATRYPQVRFMIADFLEKLAKEIKPKKTPQSEDRRYYIHQQAIEAMAFSWWVKRGGVDSRFHELAEKLFGDWEVGNKKKRMISKISPKRKSSVPISDISSSDKFSIKKVDPIKKRKYSPQFNKEVRRRLTPDLFRSIAVVGHSNWDKQYFLSLMKNPARSKPIR